LAELTTVGDGAIPIVSYTRSYCCYARPVACDDRGSPYLETRQMFSGLQRFDNNFVTPSPDMLKPAIALRYNEQAP
jgi:hypothetical protein